MSYPNQPYPPQGYAPAPPPPPPQPYPPQPQYAPGYGGAHPAGPSPVADPSPPQSSIVRPRMLDFARDNRLVLIKCTDIKRGVPNNLGKPGETQNRMTCDLVVLDGAPFPFGGQPEKGVPHTHTAQLPYEILSIWITSDGLISQCERFMNEWIAGRLGIRQLANGNTAYKLEKATDEEKAQAAAFLVAKQSGQIVSPEPIPAAQPYGPPVSAQPMAGPPPGYQQSPAQAQYMTQPAPVPQYAPPPPPAPAAVNLDECPPTIDPAWWNAQPPEVRMMYVGQSQGRPGV